MTHANTLHATRRSWSRSGDCGRRDRPDRVRRCRRRPRLDAGPRVLPRIRGARCGHVRNGLGRLAVAAGCGGGGDGGAVVTDFVGSNRGATIFAMYSANASTADTRRRRRPASRLALAEAVAGEPTMTETTANTMRTDSDWRPYPYSCARRPAPAMHKRSTGSLGRSSPTTDVKPHYWTAPASIVRRGPTRFDPLACGGGRRRTTPWAGEGRAPSDPLQTSSARPKRCRAWVSEQLLAGRRRPRSSSRRRLIGSRSCSASNRNRDRRRAVRRLCDAVGKSVRRPGRGGVTALGDPEEAMWHGIWVPGVAVEHDLVDWGSVEWSGRVDDNLVEPMREGERLSGVDVGRADLFRGPRRGVDSAHSTHDDESRVTIRAQPTRATTRADPAGCATRM